jgi:hypothetical protein
MAGYFWHCSGYLPGLRGITGGYLVKGFRNYPDHCLTNYFPLHQCKTPAYAGAIGWSGAYAAPRWRLRARLVVLSYQVHSVLFVCRA